MTSIIDHLWQSTVFAGVAWLITLLLRENRARTRYWIWLAASLKFLVPLSLLVAVGSRVEWRTAPPLAAAISPVIYEIVTPSAPLRAQAPVISHAPQLPVVLFAIWAMGALGIAISWLIRWNRMRALFRRAQPLALQLPIRTKSSPALHEPGVFGILRPVLVLPEGISDRLTPAQLRAVLAHELCHARYRDNLTSAMHMMVETLCWFHPLVWWVGRRMLDERELACDEHVLASTAEPRAYAEGILEVCKLYVTSPAFCVAGVAGANLRSRIESILARRVGHRLSGGKKLLLACAGFAALAVPLGIGMLNAPRLRAQEQPRLKFEVASVKPNKSHGLWRNGLNGNRFTMTNAPLLRMIQVAYNVPDFQITGGPSWIHSDAFDLEGRAADGVSLTAELVRPMLQSLLEDRFGLKIHRETKELPAYELRVVKGGIKFKEGVCAGQPGPDNPCGGTRLATRGMMMGREVEMAGVTATFTSYLSRTVIDKTGLTGKYNIDLTWTPDETMPHGPGDAGQPPTDPNGPSFFSALQEQLGLRLDSVKAPAQMVVIDEAKAPAGN